LSGRTVETSNSEGGAEAQASRDATAPGNYETTEVNQMPLSPVPTPNGRQLVFTSSQAARYLGVSLATVRRWTDAGHVACYRTPGGQRRFSRDQLDDFITSMQRAGHTAETNVVAHPAAKVA
jgi:excisionase family DNA binding protein